MKFKTIAVIHFGRKGAGPTISFEMAKALKKQGYNVFYYASTEVENKQYVENEKFEHRFFATYSSKWTYFLTVVFRKEINRVIASLERDKPDVIYSTMNDMWVPFIFPRLKGYMRVKTIHDVGIHEGNDSIFNKWWNNTNFKDADKFVILSRKFVPKLEERGIERNDIIVIPHAGFDYYKDLCYIHHTNSTDRPIVLFFGRIDHYKGIRILLDAMPLIIEKHPDVILRIAGNGNMQDLMSKVELYRDNIELQNRWIKDEEVGSLVSDAKLVVLPYTHATQSGVIPLAYAFSKPVVATNVGCLDEQIIEGVTGHIVEPHNPYAIAEKINLMLSNVKGTEDMGKAAYDYMKKYLTWDASAKILTNFLEGKS